MRTRRFWRRLYCWLFAHDYIQPVDMRLLYCDRCDKVVDFEE